MKKPLCFALFLLMLPLALWAQEQAVQSQSDVKQNFQQAMITSSSIIEQHPQSGKEAFSKEAKAVTSGIGETDDANYTLGTNDVIEISLLSHQELSGRFHLDSKGKIQYEFAGDVVLGGMTKKAAEDKIREVVSKYVINPKLFLKIVEYNSKSVYVIGQVTKPGKYYMRSEGIPVREAIIEAGMPLPGSAMHRARLIVPAKNSEAVFRIVDLNALLYKGDLQYNFEMHSGDQLYVPTTQEEMGHIQAKSENSPVLIQADAIKSSSENVRYTLGADDVITITVQKHPEVSGTYSVNLEGKIQLDIGGDVYVTGLTKKELEEKIGKLISGYVENPDVSVTIREYRSKVYYVIGEVGRPGKFFMRSESISVREAVVEAGLPTLAAAMRKCRLVTPAKKGKVITKDVDLYGILYGGNLDKNIDMHPGDFLYVPSTVMAKVFRIIAPVSEPVTSAASAQTGLDTLGASPATRPSRTSY